MSSRAYQPTTPGRRGMTSSDTDVLTTSSPTKSLLKPSKGAVGRSRGKITVRHRGGGAKRFWRMVDFKATEGSEDIVRAIEYDPNRSANIALVESSAGTLKYVLATSDTKIGAKIQVGSKAPIKNGNRLPLKAIPTGSFIHNIELEKGRGGQLARAAGAKAQLVSKEGEYAHIKLPSGEVRLARLSGHATIGSVGNEGHQNIKWGSAGRMRHKGKRPSVRGKAMNPADHPMGGGEGQSGPGRIPRTPWGKIAIGKKTRRREYSNKMILRSRQESKR